MDVLIGTTNPSKVEYFASLLQGCDITFYTLQDLHIRREPEERGRTPEENAILKARFYGKYFDRVICNDFGLYLDALPLQDPRQPGLHVRTPLNLPRLSDEEMIGYYAQLVRSLGGKVLAYYLNGAAVYHKGHITSFMETIQEGREEAFYMVDQPAVKRQPGWPLDSLSLDRKTLTYFVNHEDMDEIDCNTSAYYTRLVQFLKDSLFTTSSPKNAASL